MGEFANWQKYFRNQINSLAITSNRLSDQVGGDIISNFRNVEKKHFATSKVSQVLCKKEGYITVFTVI